MRALIIDNYDSYTYNLYQLIGKVSGEAPLVIKNDELSYEEAEALAFDFVVLSPGPGRPDRKEDFGLCQDFIEKSTKPILGICLGQQGLYQYYGGQLAKGEIPMHGKISQLHHEGQNLFQGLPKTFKVTRYHSLVCQEPVPDALTVDARTDDGVIMAIAHKTKPQYAVQFHPEAVASEYGEALVENFLQFARESQAGLPFKVEKEKAKLSSEEIFTRLEASGQQVLWLDSSKVDQGLARFTIFGLPSPKHSHRLTYDVNQHVVTKTGADGQVETHATDIFSYLKAHRPKWRVQDDLPCDFQLGYIGYLGYELKQDTEKVKNRFQAKQPDAYFVYCDQAIILDHETETLYFLAEAGREDFFPWVEEVLAKEAHREKPAPQALPKLQFVQGREIYQKHIAEIQELLRQGESYEVCLTNRLDILGHLEPTSYYLALRSASPGPYSAYLPLDGFSVACSSMERFIKVDRNRRVTAKPIKGTIRRGVDPKEDAELIEALRSEEKTQAENLMIVDLLRNDLGKVCELGSVHVPKLMAVETYDTLHQLVTTVAGQVRADLDVLAVLEATFPGGSMTGAPKKRTLEIIDQLESVPRGVYSGTIGYLANNGAMDFNIVIRTAIIEEEKATLGVGGAIVNLSDPEEEFEEIVLKAKGALLALQAYCQSQEKLQIEESSC